MDLLSIVFGVFSMLEVSNVLLLYFFPTSRLGNGVGVFNAFEKSKCDPEVHSLICYLVNWVAGTKLIFIVLLLVVIITGSRLTKIWCAVVLICSIWVYFWRLHPIIVKIG